MNDLDYIKQDVSELEERIDDLARRLNSAPYFLVGISGSERRHIAMFDSLKQLEGFLWSCQLKNQPSLKKISYRKKSPVYGFDKLIIERTYIPADIPFNPTLSNFR